MKRFNPVTFALAVLMVITASTRAVDFYKPDAAKTDYASTEDIWHDAARDRDVPVKIYYPVPTTGKVPVIIFSHGLGGSRESYSYVGEYWAAHGYVSVHLTHIGTDTDALMANGIENFKDTAEAAATNPKNAVDRCKDVSFAIDQLSTLNTDPASALKDHLDLSRIGVSGHSFGGNTTMLISGELTRSGRSFADTRVKCAIAMSAPVPSSQRPLDQTYANVKIPLFVMTGTLDDSPIGETKAAQRRIPFDHSASTPALLLTFDGGDHMVFSGRRQGGAKPSDANMHKLIQLGTTAFWDAYLRDDTAAKAWLTGDDYKKLVGTTGKFEERHLELAK